MTNQIRSTATCFIALLIGVPTLVGCRTQDPVLREKEPRLVLLYATCSVNREFLSPYGQEPELTPALDRFAEDARVFLRHHTEAGQSGPAFASIFTGNHAPDHGIFFHPSELHAENLTVTEVFTEAGFEAYSWLEHRMANASLGYAQGVPESHRFHTKLTADDSGFQDLLSRLKREPTLRAFVVTDFTVTHKPYTGWNIQDFCKRFEDRCAFLRDIDFRWYAELYHENHLALSLEYASTAEKLGLSQEQRENLARLARQLYEIDVAYLDQLFGEVVETIDRHGLFEESVIAFTTDHGEIHVRDNAPFRWTHGMQLAPEVLHVPLILRAPGRAVAPGEYEGVSRSIDVFPTLAGLCGLDVPEGVAGVDLTPAIRGQVPPPDLVAFSHTTMSSPQVLNERWKYPTLAEMHPENSPRSIWFALRRGDEFFELSRDRGADRLSPKLYSLDRDPEKLSNLFDEANQEHLDALHEILQYRTRLIESWGSRTEETLIGDDDALKRLRILGYVQ